MNAVSCTTSLVVTTTEVSAEPDWHDTSQLIAELATLNQRIARYITAALDADAERGKPVTSAQEATLGRQLIELGQHLQARAQIVSHEPTHPGSG